MSEVGEPGGAESAYRRYVSDYPALVLAALAQDRAIDFATLDFWRFPLLHARASGVQISAEDAFDARFRTLYADYAKDGWTGGIVLTGVTVHAAGPNHALLTGTGNRTRSDGSRIDGWESHYFMAQKESRWLSFGMAGLDPSLPAVAQWCAWLKTLD